MSQNFTTVLVGPKILLASKVVQSDPKIIISHRVTQKGIDGHPYIASYHKVFVFSKPEGLCELSHCIWHYYNTYKSHNASIYTNSDLVNSGLFGALAQYASKYLNTGFKTGFSKVAKITF